MIFNVLFLFPLFIIGIICSYTDIKYGKIKNQWIALGFIWVVFIYSTLAAFNYFYLHRPENFTLLREMAINGTVALILGYLLWNFKLLAAGDAKLFTLYAFLIPSEFYSKSYFFLFPAFVLLINIFTPLLLFLGIRALAFVFRKGIKKIKENKGKIAMSKESLIKALPQVAKLLRMYITFILIFVILQLAIRETTKLSGGIIQGPYSVYLFVFLFFIYRFLFTFISKHILISLGVTLAGGLSALYLLITGQTDFLLSVLKLALIFMVLVSFSHRLLEFYIEQKEVRKIKVKKLKEGTFLAVKGLEEELRKKLGSVGRLGINKEQVNIIRSFFSKEPDKEIKIYKTFALAPFMLLGAIISILTKDSFIALIVKAVQFLF